MFEVSYKSRQGAKVSRVVDSFAKASAIGRSLSRGGTTVRIRRVRFDVWILDPESGVGLKCADKVGFGRGVRWAQQYLAIDRSKWIMLGVNQLKLPEKIHQ